MILARVIGNVVATQKNRRYDNARVMLCQQITPEGDETSYSVLALDSVDAGVGDTVLIVQEGWSASTAATGQAGAAIDSAIVGVVDRINLLCVLIRRERLQSGSRGALSVERLNRETPWAPTLAPS